jgi:Leucine-rich repeat (LRR) protein
MSAAEDAYRAAEAAIEEAKRTGAGKLDFDAEVFGPIDTLPPQIGALDKLRELLIKNTQVSDLAPLVGMTGLETLTLDYTRVSDLVPLSGMTRLRTLSLDYTRVSDLAPLSGLTQLVTLSLQFTQVRDLAPLAGLTKLMTLWLSSAPVGDLAPLAGMTRLGGLFLTGSQVSDLVPLTGLTGLQTLWLEGTKVSDLAPLAGLKRLGEIRISDTQVSDIVPLAGLTELRMLRLDGTRVIDLSPLAEMAGMKSLWLHNTRVSDLTPLMGMTEMVTLSLGATQVLDLRPLRGLHKLAYEPRNSGLTFSDIPATTDPKIARIAEIKDDAARTKVLFALLDAGWMPPVPVEPVPLEPDPLLRSILIDGMLEIEVDPPTEDERRDQAKAVLHERLKDKARDLSVLAGNRFPRLANRARALMLLLDRPFAELDLLSVHLEIEDLEDRRTIGAEDGEPYTDEIRLAIADVTRAGPGLTVGHPSVDETLKRRREAREAVVIAEDDAKHQRLSQAVIDDAAANGPNSRAMEELLHRVADQAAARALREAKHRNLIRTLVVPAVSVPRDVAINVAATLIATAYGPAITAFVTSNYGLLSEVAATYGQGVLVWFQQTVGPLMAGIDTTVIRPVERPKREKR